MTEDSPSQRGDSPTAEVPPDAATGSESGPSTSQDKGKAAARDEHQSEGDSGVARSEPAAGRSDDEDSSDGSEQDEEDSDDDEDEEPRLKYARLTQHLGPVYRNGDATSAFLVAGDKMVCHSLLPGSTWRNADPRLH